MLNNNKIRKNYTVLYYDTILGNESADELAKKDADTPFTGPEPILGEPYNVVKRAIGDWMERKHRVLEV